MSVAALSTPDSLARPVSPFRELGAYEALWTQPSTSFKSLAEKFGRHPGALPSDFVPEEQALDYARRARALLAEAGVGRFGLRVHGAGEYPASLRSAQHPLALLYYQGWWDLVASKCLAVVGTRDPSEDGRARTRKLVRHLLDEDFTVVSGLARGIDTIVHQTAMAEGGRTIAVIGTPLDMRYPTENAALQDRIAAEHLLLSQVPVIRYRQSSNPTANRFFFVERNITMSALTLGTVIVEAGKTSGTLVQARHALQQGKKLFILENNFRNPDLEWPAKFEKQGAIRVRGFADIQEHLAGSSIAGR